MESQQFGFINFINFATCYSEGWAEQYLGAIAHMHCSTAWDIDIPFILAVSASAAGKQVRTSMQHFCSGRDYFR